jgi:hypothetical protein
LEQLGRRRSSWKSKGTAREEREQLRKEPEQLRRRYSTTAGEKSEQLGTKGNSWGGEETIGRRRSSYGVGNSK